MLILTRRVGETIRINDDISIQVLGMCGQQVRLGITAPVDVAVPRRSLRTNPSTTRDRQRGLTRNESTSATTACR